MPNRLKININFDSQVLRYGKTNRATVTSAWLHGAPARDLRVNMSAILSQSTTAFNNYPGYVFDDPARSFYAEEQEVFDGRLNDKGAVTFNPNISVRTSAPGVLKASFTVRVFEEGGAFSIDRFTLPYHPTNTTWVSITRIGEPRQCFIPIPPIRLTSLPLLPKGYPCPIIAWKWKCINRLALVVDRSERIFRTTLPVRTTGLYKSLHHHQFQRHWAIQPSNQSP